MPSMAAETGNFVSAQKHYDLLIAEGNDPVLDPPALAAYMDSWDGEALMDALCLSPDCRVLEIGVGTGRLALRVLKRGCSSFVGIDLSEKTLAAARIHLADFPQAALMQGEFPQDTPEGPFERIYSSLTFLHIEDKEAACREIARLLVPGGRCVLSLDRQQEPFLDMGIRCVRTYPDDPKRISQYLREAGLNVLPVIGLEQAHLVIAERPL